MEREPDFAASPPPRDSAFAAVKGFPCAIRRPGYATARQPARDSKSHLGGSSVLLSLNATVNPRLLPGLPCVRLADESRRGRKPARPGPVRCAWSASDITRRRSGRRGSSRPVPTSRDPVRVAPPPSWNCRVRAAGPAAFLAPAGLSCRTSTRRLGPTEVAHLPIPAEPSPDRRGRGPRMRRYIQWLCGLLVLAVCTVAYAQGLSGAGSSRSRFPTAEVGPTKTA